MLKSGESSSSNAGESRGGEFYTPERKPRGTVEFDEVIAHLPLKKLYLPKETTIAQEIHRIVTNKELSSPQAVYDELSQLKTEDLRPHLLLLLKSFKVGDKSYSITQGLFETLHAWVEFTQSNLHPSEKIRALPPQEGVLHLRLNDEQMAEFQERVNAAQTTSVAQKTVFYIPIDHGHIKQRVLFALYKLIELTECEPQIIYQRLIGNIKFLKKYAYLYQIDALETVVNKLEAWANQVREYLNGTQNGEFPPFPCPKAEIAKLSLLLYIPQDIHVSTSVMSYEYHPLLEYQYDEEKKNWYFISLSARMRQWYYEVTGQKNGTVFCYGPISPQELTRALLDGKPRLGNITHYEPDPKHYASNVFHKEPQVFLAAALMHDSAHMQVCSKIAGSRLQHIIASWIQLIGERTKLFATVAPDNKQIPYTKETWYLTDQPVPEIFLAKNELDMLSMIFHNFSTFISNANIVQCMLILDMLKSDQYYGLAKSNQPLPLALQRIEDYRDRVMKVYQQLSVKNSDPYILACIFIYTLLEPRMLAHINVDTIVQFSSKITWQWKKAKPGNHVQLHADMPDLSFKTGPEDKNVYINSYII